MLAFHEKELNNLKSSWQGSLMSPTYRGFKREHMEAISKYRSIIEKLTGINLGEPAVAIIGKNDDEYSGDDERWDYLEGVESGRPDDDNPH